jgi:Ni/Fe-hydrogenase subunit HybB-like protein
MNGKVLFYSWLVFLLILIGVGAAFLPKYYHSYEPWETKDAIPWGILVPSYVYFALVAGGSSIVASLYTIFGYKGEDKGFEKTIKHSVWFALMAVIPAWIMILLDLGRIDHFASMITGFNVTARIAWMGASYVFYFLMLLIELVYLIRADANPRLREWKAAELSIALLEIFATVAVYTNLGEVFGASTGVPGWYGPHTGLYFLAGAVVVGAAWQALYLATVYYFQGRYGGGDERGLGEIKGFLTGTFNKILLVAIPILGIFEFWNVMIAYYYPPAWAAYKQILYGDFKYSYWVGEVGFGLLVSYALAVYAYLKRDLLVTYVNAIILIIAGYISKLVFIIGGEIGRLAFAYGGLTNNLNPYHVRFWPYHYEIGTPEKMMVLLAVSIWLFLLTLGEWLLPLERGEKPRHLWVFR